MLTIYDRSKQPGVRGVVISDHAGRCMSASGSLPSSAASRIKTILDAAVALGDGNEIPIVTIDTEKGTTTISGTNGVYTAVASPAPDPK